MTKPTEEEAETERFHRVLEASRVYDLCECLWPLVKMRNGDGHDPDCPAHEPLGRRRK